MNDKGKSVEMTESQEEVQEVRPSFADIKYRRMQETKEKSQNLDPLSKEVIIYRVPYKLRKVNDEAYSPCIVSIGPFHQGNDAVAAMREHKWYYMQYFFNRIRDPRQSLECREACTNAIYGFEARVRRSYNEKISADSHDLVEMMLLDGCFILELFLRYIQRLNETSRDESDPIFTCAWMIPELRHDLALLENQIPFFILKCLYEALVHHLGGTELPNPVEILALKFFLPLSNKEITQEGAGIGCDHLLDLMCNFYFFPSPAPLAGHSSGCTQSTTETNNVEQAPAADSLSTELINFSTVAPDMNSTISHMETNEQLPAADDGHVAIPLPTDSAGEEIEFAQGSLNSTDMETNEQLPAADDGHVAIPLPTDSAGEEIEFAQGSSNSTDVETNEQQPAADDGDVAIPLPTDSAVETRPSLPRRQPTPPFQLLRTLRYSAEQLLLGGIKIREGSTRDQYLLNITFDAGVITIPQVSIGETTDSVFRNRIAFEQCCLRKGHYVTSYVILMKSLISSSRDMSRLRKRRIIAPTVNNADGEKLLKHVWKKGNILHPIESQENWNYFESMLDEVVVKRNDFYFADLCTRVNATTSGWYLMPLVFSVYSMVLHFNPTPARLISIYISTVVTLLTVLNSTSSSSSASPTIQAQPPNP